MEIYGASEPVFHFAIHRAEDRDVAGWRFDVRGTKLQTFRIGDFAMEEVSAHEHGGQWRGRIGAHWLARTEIIWAGVIAGQFG